MRVASTQRYSPPYYYKTYAIASLIWAGQGVAPHSVTTRASYTVPSGKKAHVTGLWTQVVRITAATTLGRVFSIVSIQFGDDLLLTHFDNNVGHSESASILSGVWLNAGQSVAIVTGDLSTAGSLDYAATVQITEVTF